VLASVLAAAVAEAVEEVAAAARDRFHVKSGKMEMALMGRRRGAAIGAANRAISRVNAGPRRRRAKQILPRRRNRRSCYLSAVRFVLNRRRGRKGIFRSPLFR
jgi:hypothetical protein